MGTIRRLYVYTVSFISLEVVIWGLIGLVRSVVGGELIGGGTSQLASAISLIAVGVPVFLLHWWLAQRRIDDEDERFSLLRAIFLYGTLLTTLIPVAQNILAFLNRVWLQIFDLPVRMAFIGSGQSWVDNSIAAVINGLMGAYFYSIVQKDWMELPHSAPAKEETFAGTRRFYRYLWVIYSLVMVVGGVQQVLGTILKFSGTIGKGSGTSLANGLSLLIIGTPLWVYAWRNVQVSLTDDNERRSTLRLVVLFILSLVGISGVLVPAGMILNVIFLAIFGGLTSFGALLAQMSDPFSAAIPFAGLWLYYGRHLKAEVAALPDQTQRAGIRRLYLYILSFAGLVATFLGLTALLSFITDTLLQTISQVTGLRERLSIALSTLTIGIPLWLISWRPVILETSQDDEPGDHARRSLVRKVYLYLIIFAAVIGVMVSAGSLIYQVLSKVLGDPLDNFQRASWMLLETLLLFALLLIYHWIKLRADSRLAEKALAAKHEAFPALILVAEIGNFSNEIMKALQRELPSLPVVVHGIENGVPDETLSEAKVVILSGGLAAHPTEAIRLWLQAFHGTRLVVPTPADGWLWAFGSGRSLSSLARRTAIMVRILSEGEDLPKIRDNSAWMVLIYILAGIVGIPILIGLFSALGELIF